jgi:electron transfer flavoprotein alpha subunit
MPHTYQVRDFAPKLAASLGKGMIGDCIHYRYENGKLIFVRQMFQGRTNADVVFTGDAPWIATFQASAFRGRHGRQRLQRQSACKFRLVVDLQPEQIRMKPARAFPRSQASRGPHTSAHSGFDRARHQGSGKYSPWRKN